MKTTLLILFLGAIGHAQAAERGAPPPSSRTACNQQATAAQVTGEARKNYLRDCLQNRWSAPFEKSLTPQQQRMRRCSAHVQGGDPDERRRAINDCMAQPPY